MKRLLLLVGLVTTMGCADDTSTTETLRKAGYTDISTTGWAPFTCAEEDTFSTGFIAKNPRGVQVEGVVCCGLVVKACTIRF